MKIIHMNGFRIFRRTTRVKGSQVVDYLRETNFQAFEMNLSTTQRKDFFT